MSFFTGAEVEKRLCLRQFVPSDLGTMSISEWNCFETPSVHSQGIESRGSNWCLHISDSTNRPKDIVNLHSSSITLLHRESCFYVILLATGDPLTHATEF